MVEHFFYGGVKCSVHLQHMDKKQITSSSTQRLKPSFNNLKGYLKFKGLRHGARDVNL